jgi:hypothetical protein
LWEVVLEVVNQIHLRVSVVAVVLVVLEQRQDFQLQPEHLTQLL